MVYIYSFVDKIQTQLILPLENTLKFKNFSLGENTPVIAKATPHLRFHVVQLTQVSTNA